MWKVMKPRLLGLLRIEDEDADSPAKLLPVEDLGRVGRWSDFVFGLARGKVVASGRPGTAKEVRTMPEILTVDFRFDCDTTTPSLKRNAADLAHPVYGNVGWSQWLSATNTGVAIGATLMGAVAQRDLPTVTTLHTLVSDDTRKDVTTVLLVAQMLASAGEEFTPDEDPFLTAYRLVDRL